MKKLKHVPLTPSVLSWAIAESGLTIDEIATRMNLDVGTLARWQREERQPTTLTELKRLSQVLKRQLATFFLPEPPTIIHPQVEFRRPPDSDRTRPNAKELRYLREASRLQRALSWIQRELSVEQVDLPKISNSANPDRAADQLRASLKLSVDEQLSWGDPAKALQGWRNALEAYGIHVFLFPMGADSCRGFSLWDDYAPAIAVNTHWKNEARIFTIFHELGHLVTRSNSFCVSPGRQFLINDGDSHERWCEKFASAVLLPWLDVRRVLQQKLGWSDGAVIAELNDLRVVARLFKVSLQAAALRLIESGVATWSLYQSIPEWADNKPKGGRGKGRVRKEIRESEYGQRTTKVFRNALNEELMTRRDVLSYLEVTDSDLYEIQKISTG